MKLTETQEAWEYTVEKVTVNTVMADIGINGGEGALGPFNHANATIGRASGLLPRNLGGGATNAYWFAADFTYLKSRSVDECR